MNRIIAVCGPTASGKSALAIELCEAFGGEVVSFDSMQIYRGLDVGTAKPSAAERALVPHHLIDICEPAAKFSAADFIDAARRVVNDVLERGKNAVLCGGTGLYLDSFIFGREYGELSGDEELRASLYALARKRGNAALHAVLEELDPVAADAIHRNNVKRVVRAIEICKTSKMTKTEWDKRAQSNPPRKTDIVILDFHDRAALYERINARVEAMISNGLVSETERLYASGALSPDGTASQAIGYKEIIPYIKNEISLSEAVENLKTATRRYAKRQITWFKKYDGYRLYVDEYNSPSELAEAAVLALGKV